MDLSFYFTQTKSQWETEYQLQSFEDQINDTWTTKPHCRRNDFFLGSPFTKISPCIQSSFVRPASIPNKLWKMKALSKEYKREWHIFSAFNYFQIPKQDAVNRINFQSVRRSAILISNSYVRASD